jgi:terminase, large subunit
VSRLTEAIIDEMDVEPDEWEAGILNFLECCDELWIDRPDVTVSEYAEQFRVLPSDTPFPGPWRNERTPYLVEIMDNLSAFSGIERTIVVKGTQLGFTTAAENALGYWIDVVPSKIMFTSATQELLETWSSTRLDKMIDSCGLREKIFSQSMKRHGKATGDRTFRKEYMGGFLALCSAQSSPSLRANDIRVLFRDEIDGAPRSLKSGEGNWLDVSRARTDSWDDRKKIFDFSTPTTIEESSIWPAYESADQRRYFVPCLRCGTVQALEFGHGFGHENPAHGIQWELQDGNVKSAWYVCPHCGGRMFGHEKDDFLALKGRGGAAEWCATSKSYSPKVRSYQIGSLYSPAGMLRWEDIALEFLQAQEGGADSMRSFVTLRLGLPFRETGARPDWRTVIECRGVYHAGTVPKGPVFLTAAVDVQRGSEKEDGKKARLEWAVCGHGPGYRTWDIEHRVFEGEIDDPYSGAWALLEEYWRGNRMTWKSADGREFVLKAVLVDSGDGPHTASVYTFVSKWAGVWASKGMASIRRKPGEPIDDDVNRSIRRFRVAKIDADKPLVEINGVYYKQRVYSSLKVPRKSDTVVQAPNFCDFPFEYSEDYFKQLTAEEMKIGRDHVVTFTKSSARPNEALDLRVMNLAAADFFLDNVVLQIRAAEKARGLAPDKIAAINSRTALEFLQRQAAAAKPKSIENQT